MNEKKNNYIKRVDTIRGICSFFVYIAQKTSW